MGENGPTLVMKTLELGQELQGDRGIVQMQMVEHSSQMNLKRKQVISKVILMKLIITVLRLIIFNQILYMLTELGTGLIGRSTIILKLQALKKNLLVSFILVMLKMRSRLIGQEFLGKLFVMRQELHLLSMLVT